jgi:hypothetical protein
MEPKTNFTTSHLHTFGGRGVHACKNLKVPKMQEIIIQTIICTVFIWDLQNNLTIKALNPCIPTGTNLNV